METAAKKTVAILGLGPSVAAYLDITKCNGTRRKLASEVWSINALGDIFQCDRVFHMDDVRVQEIRAAAAPEGNIAPMLEWMRSTSTPIVTSRKREGYPSLVEFPLEAVVNDLGIAYFNSTAAYAVALAIHERFDVIRLFGCDFTYPNAHHAERGRGCVEFWLGVAHGRGIKLSVPLGTSLLDATEPFSEKFYGFNACNVDMKQDEAGIFSIAVSDRETLPTAAQVEAAYDHDVHPNPLVEA